MYTEHVQWCVFLVCGKSSLFWENKTKTNKQVCKQSTCTNFSFAKNFDITCIIPITFNVSSITQMQLDNLESILKTWFSHHATSSAQWILFCKLTCTAKIFCPDRLHVHTIPYILLLLKWQISLQWQPLCNAKSFHPWVAVTERFYYTVKKNHFFPYHGAHIWTNNTLYLTMMLTAPVHHGSYSTMYLAYSLLFSDNNECFLLVANMHTIIYV